MQEYCTTLAETGLGEPAGDLFPGSPDPSSRKTHPQRATRPETR